MNMTKIKQNITNGWKPLKLEGAVLSDGLEGLIGIEELTDYKLEKRNGKTNISVSENKKKKRKSATKRKHLNENEEQPDIANAEPLLKKSKIKESKKKSLKKGNKKITNNQIKPKHSIEHNSENEFSDDISDNDNDDNISHLTNINIQAWSTLGVPSVVIKALADQNFHSPTIIQALTLAPAILGHRDILGAAETGSGKTLAFGIPIINGILELKSKQLKLNKCKNESLQKSVSKNEGSSSESDMVDEEENEKDSDKQLDADGLGCVRVIDNVKINESHNLSQKPLYALILTPTRELAIQIKNHLTKAAKYTDIKIAVVVGGMAAVKQERILSKGPEIVIATPGRLWELIQEGNSHLSQVDSIRYLAIDETDRMLEKGHFQELHDLLEKINFNVAKVKMRQTFVFSATLTLVHDIPEYLQRKKKKHFKSRIYKLTPGQKLQKVIEMLKIKNPKIVDVTKESGTASNLTECRIACTIDHKDYYLYYFLKRHPGRTLVFCNSIGCVRRLATLFSILNCNPLPLHANMVQKQRLKNLERFQTNEYGILIATDVAARGLDIPNVEHVIHYQVPRTSESYIHRSGRTARAEKEGITVLMMEPSEKYSYSKLCKTLGRTQDLPTFPVVDRLLIAVKERVNVAREIDKLELKCRRENVQKAWLQKAAEDMDLILNDDDEERTEIETKEMADLRHQLKIKKHQLTSLLTRPVFPKGFSGKYPDINVDPDISYSAGKAIEVMKNAIEEIPNKKKEISVKKNKKSRNTKKV